MEPTLTLILLGTVLGALEVTLGILIGRWVLRRNERALRRELSPKEIQSIAVNLYERILSAEGHLGDGHVEAVAANAAAIASAANGTEEIPTASTGGTAPSAKKPTLDVPLDEATLTSVCNQLRVRLAQVADAENEPRKQ